MKPAFISKRSIGNNQTPVVLLYPTVLPYLLPFLIPADVWLGVPPRLAVHHDCVTRSEDNSMRNRVDYWGRWRREREGREGDGEGERERRREEGKERGGEGEREGKERGREGERERREGEERGTEE